VGFEGIGRILSIPPVPPLCLVTTPVTPGLPIMRSGGIVITLRRIRAGGASPSQARPLFMSEQVFFTSNQITTNDEAEPQVISFPASEQRISEVERGRICNAVLPMPGDRTISAGDSILFALAYLDVGQDTCYVKCGDSVCVSLTDVTDLEATDPATGQALFRFSWQPPGQDDSPGTVAERVVPRGAHHRTNQSVALLGVRQSSRRNPFCSTSAPQSC
jgi:hypothetical protein